MLPSSVEKQLNIYQRRRGRGEKGSEEETSYVLEETSNCNDT